MNPAILLILWEVAIRPTCRSIILAATRAFWKYELRREQRHDQRRREGVDRRGVPRVEG